MRARTLIVGLTFACLLASLPAGAASNRGNIRGLVTDADEKPIVGMKVTATNLVNPTQVLTTESKKNGRFTFILDPVEHRLVFEKEGYRPFETVIKVRATNMDFPFMILSEEQHQQKVATIVASTPKIRELEVNDQYNRALEAMDKGLKADADSDARSKNLTQARDEFRAILAALPELDPSKVEKLPGAANIHVLLGTIALQLKELPAAEAAFAEAVRLAPDLPAPYLQLGELAVQRGDKAAAVEYWRRYRELKPEDDSVVYNLAVLAFQSGKWETAADNLRRAIELNPENSEAHRLLGHTYLKLSKQADAKKSFQAYLQKRPDAPDKQDIEDLIAILP